MNTEELHAAALLMAGYLAGMLALAVAQLIGYLMKRGGT